jgi:hypothetical protein
VESRSVEESNTGAKTAGELTRCGTAIRRWGGSHRVLLRRIALLQLLMEYLSGNLDALVAGSLDDFIVGTVDLGSVKDVADTFDHIDVCLGSIDPCILLLVKEPFMDTAIRDGHT